MNNLFFTQFIFYSILCVFCFFTISYWTESKGRLLSIQKQPLYFDVRYWITCLTYAFVLGYRWDYSHDWMQYHDWFVFGEWNNRDIEIGYFYLNIILKKLGFDFYSIFILEGFIYITAIYMLVRDDRLTLVFVLPLMYMGNRYICLVVSRQFLAMSIVWIGFSYLIKGKKIVFLLLSLVAYTIHSVIIILVPFFFLIKKIYKFTIPSLHILLYVYFFIAIGSFAIKEYIVDNFDWMLIFLGKDSYIDKIFNDDFTKSEYDIYHFILYTALGGGYIVSAHNLLKKGVVKSLNHYILLCLCYFGLCFNAFANNNELIGRFFWGVSCLNYIGFGLLCYYNVRYRKDVPLVAHFFAFIIVLQIAWSMYSNIINEGTGPDKFFLEYK